MRVLLEIINAASAYIVGEASCQQALGKFSGRRDRYTLPVEICSLPALGTEAFIAHRVKYHASLHPAAQGETNRDGKDRDIMGIVGGAIQGVDIRTRLIGA